jgi:hypothetical protein
MINCKIVYGPQGCGKTRNSEVLMKKLGCNRVVDIEEVRRLSEEPRETLVLTSLPHPQALDYEAVMAKA